MDRDALIALWVLVCRAPVPRKISLAYLRRFLAFELQARRHGGLAPALLARIRAAEAGASGRAPTHRLQPGARLLREWNGATHAVEVTEAGYLWHGQTYRSLSVIARTITGAHWSGPRFFGLAAGGKK